MKSFLLQVLALIVVVAAHFALSCIGFYNSFGKYESLSLSVYFFSYVTALKHLIGLSLGLLAYFSAYSIRKYLETKELSAVLAGIIVALILLFSGYLSFGIHESTGMFDFFVGKIGTVYVKIQFLFLFATTSISVITGSIIVWRKSKKFY